MNVPMGGTRFKRFGAALMDEDARLRLCESSGSQHESPDTDATDLSDLVNSFIEIECCAAHDDQEADSETRLEVDHTKSAIAVIGERPYDGYKRILMSHLRDRGFDAGLCKSRWEKFGRHTAGEHDYVDVRTNDGDRYIVEVFLAEEFQIARPKNNYTALIRAFPEVFVGRPEELKKIVRLMCNSIKETMKDMDMQVPPWRRNGYMQAKWFGGYKRTTNSVPGEASNGSSSPYKCARNRSVGFVSVPNVRLFRCMDDLVRKAAMGKQGYLAAAFNGEAS